MEIKIRWYSVKNVIASFLEMNQSVFVMEQETSFHFLNVHPPKGQIIFKPELEHFVSIVNFKDEIYFFDDLQPKLQKASDHLSGGTNSVFYIKKK
jgi:hypothetical protein